MLTDNLSSAVVGRTASARADRFVSQYVSVTRKPFCAAAPLHGTETIIEFQGVTTERWEVLYRDAFPRVYRALVAVLFDRERALDALHDAFLEGLRRPPRDDRNLEGWLYRVALRRARRGWFTNLPLIAGDTTADETERALDRVEVGRQIRKLTARQREIVVARYFLQMTYEEISSHFGISRGTVGATINKALARMREGAPHVA